MYGAAEMTSENSVLTVFQTNNSLFSRARSSTACVSQFSWRDRRPISACWACRTLCSGA